MHTIDFKVDSEDVKTTEQTLTPVQIMGLAGIDATSHYLVQIEGQHQVSYQGKPDEKIHMHPHMVFITVSTGPTPVSME
jgi:hypothetical protein